MIDFKFIGWCQEDNHDKVWGVITLQSGTVGRNDWKFMVFWGKRGSKLRTTIIPDSLWAINEKIESKRERGYSEVESTNLNTLYPEFEEDLHKAMVWARLKA